MLDAVDFSHGVDADGAIALVRSAWAGSQRYGALLWSGDIPATWKSLRVQLRAGLNAGLAGIPWWTTDAGGFHGGDAADPAYQELMLRWFQWMVYSPVLLRERLRPYVVEQMRSASECGVAPMRPLFVDHPGRAHPRGVPSARRMVPRRVGLDPSWRWNRDRPRDP